ncbi:LysR family transcriptional regulator [Methylorubrum aminovorans]
MTESAIDWDDLRILHFTATEGSMLAAARRLGISHATVSRRLARLEQGLGLRLLNRMATGIVLTPDGQELGRLTARMAEDALALLRQAKGRSLRLSGDVVIAVTPGLAGEIVTALAPVSLEHPGIVLSVVSAISLASLDRLEADLAIRLTRPEETSHTRRRLGAMQFALCAARGYDFSAKAGRFIGYSQRFDGLAQQRWLIEQAGSEGLALRIDDIEVQRKAALAGLGIALLPEFMVTDDELVRVPFDGPLPTREIWLAQHRDTRKALAVRLVAKRLTEAFERDARFSQA